MALITAAAALAVADAWIARLVLEGPDVGGGSGGAVLMTGSATGEVRVDMARSERCAAAAAGHRKRLAELVAARAGRVGQRRGVGESRVELAAVSVAGHAPTSVCCGVGMGILEVAHRELEAGVVDVA